MAQRPALRPKPQRRLQALARGRCLPHGPADHRAAGPVQGDIVGVDQLVLAELVEDRLPVAVAEGVDDNPVALQQQRDRAVLGAVAGGRNVGASAAVVELAPQRPHNAQQTHGAASGPRPWSGLSITHLP